MRIARPRMRDIDIRDIAHALSQLCRYNGHTAAFYSVAQHSVVVSHLADAHPLWGLLHDAAEAYVGDMTAPWKRCSAMGPLYRQAERRFQRVICDRFDLSQREPPDVRDADMRIWHREKELFLLGDTEWAAVQDIPPDPRARHLLVCAWGPAEAEERFLARFAEVYEGGV